MFQGELAFALFEYSCFFFLAALPCLKMVFLPSWLTLAQVYTYILLSGENEESDNSLTQETTQKPHPEMFSSLPSHTTRLPVIREAVGQTDFCQTDGNVPS